MMFYEPNKLYIRLMDYNWQQQDWPFFKFEAADIESVQIDFGLKSGQTEGKLDGLSEEEQNSIIVDIMISEAIKTSEIEGEFLSRQDVMSSIKKNLGVHEEQPKQIKDQRAKGIAQLMTTVRKYYQKPLSKEMLYQWHKLLMNSNKYINAGQWRSHSSPMQVVSGRIGKETVHFEAPPSSEVPKEMDGFIEWFNNTAPSGTKPIYNPLIRSAITHLYFESIHPFEDGNGRIGRALSEKALSQGIGRPVLLSLSTVMEAKRDAYYQSLKKAQRSNEITQWLKYFSNTVLEAQEQSKKQVDFSLKKVKFFDRNTDKLNERQLKVINRMFLEGLNSFEGGMSAKNYIAITKASKATATRDLQSLVELGVFLPFGGGRSVRYEVVV